MTDNELFATIRDRLFTAVLGDVMDIAGHSRQFLPPEVKPIAPDMVLVGRAMPVQLKDVGPSDVAADAFGLMFKALDELKNGEIYITAGGSLDYALWGGLMSARAQRLGSPGAVFDGFHRDTREIISLGFPVFSRGAYAQDQRGRGLVVDFRCPVEFANGARAEPGDIIVGDVDGVVIVPARHEMEIIQAALTKVDGEDGVRRMIESGESTQDVFAKTGIM